MIELLIMALIFSVVINIVQALSNEFQKGYRIGMNHASELEERIERLDSRTHKLANNLCSTNDQVEKIWQLEGFKS
jgi:hypothetical protein